MTWAEIESDYEIFMQCIFNSRGEDPWTRNEGKGREHLLKAYAKAQQMPEKNHLLYARILFDMYQAFECGIPRTFALMGGGDGFLAEAQKEYELARKENTLEKKELARFNNALARIKYSEEKAKYESKQRAKDCWHHKEHLQLLNNYELLQDFVFHDGMILKFEHFPAEQAAVAQIGEGYFENEVEGKINIATLRFDGVTSIQYAYDQDGRWLDDVYFYPAFRDQNTLLFDFGSFCIYSKKITVTDVSLADAGQRLADYMWGVMPWP